MRVRGGIRTLVFVISQTFVVHPTLSWQNEKVCVSVGVDFSLESVLFSLLPRQSSMTSLDYWIRVVEKLECLEWKAASGVKRSPP